MTPRYASAILDRRVEVFGLSLHDGQWRMPEKPLLQVELGDLNNEFWNYREGKFNGYIKTFHSLV